jgi:uncharacterized protein (UPF0332 family)
MPKKPPISELDFLKITGNHAEFSRKLSALSADNPDVAQYAQFVSEAWFRLGEEHLAEAKNNNLSNCSRSVFSRAYYGAYNASKGTRYLANGFVSLKGDDHGKASVDLPADFPDLATWTTKISGLYEHRLRADYDNWSTTAADQTMTPLEAIQTSEEFINTARTYLNTKFGMKL